MSEWSGSIKEMQKGVDNLFVDREKQNEDEDILAQVKAPWDTERGYSKFFENTELDGIRWDRVYPYRLLVVDGRTKRIILHNNMNEEVPTLVDVPYFSWSSQGVTTLDFKPINPASWIFTLPITPQQLNITDQYAINTSATLRGIIEEHGGIRFKNITASGTMGVWPFRTEISHNESSNSTLSALFGGTIESAGSVIGQFNRTINTITSSHPANPPKTTRPESGGGGLVSTGYYCAMALQRFLEQYVEAKKDPNNAHWRLVFDIPKQNQSFVVTPVQFVWQQNANKPLEILYTMQFKAWRRIQLDAGIPIETKPKISLLEADFLTKALNTITEARKTVSSIVNLTQAIRSDFKKPFEVLRQSSLFVKDLIGAAITCADLPSNLIKDIKGQLSDTWKNLTSAFGSTETFPSGALSKRTILQYHEGFEGLSGDAIESGQSGINLSNKNKTDPLNEFFDNPEKYFDSFNSATIDDLALTPQQQEAVDATIEETRSLTVDDLRQFKSTMQEFSFQLSDNYGVGDSYYNSVYNKAAPKDRIQEITLDEYDVLRKIYDVIQVFDSLTSTSEIDDQNKRTNMEYVSDLAGQSDITFNIPDSKIYVPVPFGLTIEEIALRYLGDPQRWLEIVTLNNLRSPYIDENGFKLTLLSNASGRQINVNSSENLYIGQRVTLSSSTQNPTTRKILGIDRLSDTNYLITLDGQPNLNNFLTVNSAYMQAYLPGTVNSQQKIFLPSYLPAEILPNITPPVSTQGDPLVGMSLVDWLLTDTGDIAINNYGDFRYSAGITNLIQALKIKMGTIQGQSVIHPGFGFGIRPGTSNADISPQDIYGSIQQGILADQRYSGLTKLLVELDGTAVKIGMEVALAGQQGILPLTFQLKE